MISTIVLLLSFFVLVVCLILLIANCVTSNEKQLKERLLENADKDIFTESIHHKTFYSVYEKVKQLSSSPLEKTSIAIDLPRLSSKISISKNSNEKIIFGNSVYEKYENTKYQNEFTMKEIISALITLLEGEELKMKFENEFDELFEYIRNETDGDAATVMKELLPKVFTEKNITLAVLKTLTQALFASAVEYLLPFRRTHRFHDGHVGWNIQVDVTDEKVIITHTKGETSYVENGFDFEWKYTYVIDREKKEIVDLKLEIVNVIFKEYPENLRNDFNEIVKKYNENSFLEKDDELKENAIEVE